MTIVGHELGESSGKLGVIEFAKALDDGVLGWEIAVEIAGARADFIGDVLHGRRVEAVADESVLGGFEDALASLGVCRTSCRNGYHRHAQTHENERSFS